MNVGMSLDLLHRSIKLSKQQFDYLHVMIFKYKLTLSSWQVPAYITAEVTDENYISKHVRMIKLH